MLKRPVVLVVNMLESHYSKFKHTLYSPVMSIFEADNQPVHFLPIRNASDSSLAQRIDYLDRELRKHQEPHVVGISIAGLDCRLSMDLLSTPVTSLTTVSSPHKGSSLADFASTPSCSSDTIQPILRYLGVPLEAFLEISLRNLKSINANISSNQEKVFSISSWKDVGEAHEMFKETIGFIDERNPHYKAYNDGVFTEWETQWGTHLLSFDMDHTEIVGSDLHNNCAFIYRLVLDNIRMLEKVAEGKILING